MLKKEEFKVIINSVNYKLMPIHYKIQYFIVKNGKINILLIYYRIRKFFSLIKDFLMKR